MINDKLKMIKFGLWVLILGFTAVAVGCGQQVVQEEVTPVTSQAIISGKLYTGTIASSIKASSVRAYAENPAADKTVVAIGKKLGKIYFSGKSGSDGSFSINVPSGEAFMLAILDKFNKLEAPIGLATGEGYLTMGLTIEAGTADLGKIVIDTSKKAAVPTSTPSASLLDTTLKARTKSGEDQVPVGAGNFGKGTEAQTTEAGTGIDRDKDGLADVLDADNDGNGIVDEIDGQTDGNMGSEHIQNAGLFMNLKIDFANTYSINLGRDTIITIEIIPQSGHLTHISQVKITSGPSYIQTASIEAGEGIPDYPTSGTPWKDEDYKLYKSSDRYTVWVSPRATMEAGDTFVFHIDYTDGSSEEVAKMVNYVFYDIPKLVTYNTIPAPSEYPSPDNYITFEGTSLALTWSKPQDDLGEITGMNYSFAIFYYGDLGQQLTSEAQPLGIDALSGTITPTSEVNGTAVDTFKVDITASSQGGDNAAQMIRFKKI